MRRLLLFWLSIIYCAYCYADSSVPANHINSSEFIYKESLFVEALSCDPVVVTGSKIVCNNESFTLLVNGQAISTNGTVVSQYNHTWSWAPTNALSLDINGTHDVFIASASYNGPVTVTVSRSGDDCILVTGSFTFWVGPPPSIEAIYTATNSSWNMSDPLPRITSFFATIPEDYRSAVGNSNIAVLWEISPYGSSINGTAEYPSLVSGIPNRADVVYSNCATFGTVTARLTNGCGSSSNFSLPPDGAYPQFDLCSSPGVGCGQTSSCSGGSCSISGEWTTVCRDWGEDGGGIKCVPKYRLYYNGCIPTTSSIIVSPNPAEGELAISVEDLISQPQAIAVDQAKAKDVQRTYQIFNTGGRLMRSGTMAGARDNVSLSGLPTGTYHLVLLENGKMAGRKTFMKQ